MQMKVEEQTYLSILFAEPAEKIRWSGGSKRSSMWRAGNSSEGKSGKFSEQCFGSTYIDGSVALEGAVVDLHIGTAGMNSAALEVACGPPEHREISGSFF